MQTPAHAHHGTCVSKRALQVTPELQLGFNVSALEPMYQLSLNDDDYQGLSFSPITHPAVLGSGAALFAAMMRWRFPISASLTPFTLHAKERNVRAQVNVFTRTQREGANPCTTTNLYGTMLTIVL